MPAREVSRLLRRRAVAEAARALRTEPLPSPGSRGLTYKTLFVLMDSLDAALALPKPWTAGGQRWQPKRTTRRQRRRRVWIEERQFWAEVQREEGL